MSKKSMNKKSSPKKLNENELLMKCMDRVQDSTDELVISTKSLLNLTETGIRKTADNTRCVQVSLCKIFFFCFINYFFINRK